MTVLDAYAVLAYLRAEPCADEVAGLLRHPTVLSDPALTAVMRAEGGAVHPLADSKGKEP